MKTSDNSTPHFSSIYDEQVKNTIPYYDCFHLETINFIKSTRMNPKVWLDTGCGTGSLVKQASVIFKETDFILADPSSGMLEVAKGRLKNIHRVKILDSVPTQKISLQSKVNIVTAIQSHHYSSQPVREEATQVCWNLLEVDGIYITFKNIRQVSTEGIKLGKDYWSDFQISKGKDAESVRKHIERFDVEYFPITVDEHLALLRKIGFRVVELFWYSYMQAGFYGIK